MNQNETEYRRTIAELQELARRAPHVTQDWILQVASMDPAEMRRRLIRNYDWHGHFNHSLDGIKEIRSMPGAGMDGMRSHTEVRAIVETLVKACPLTWEDSYQGRPKTTSPLSNGRMLSSAELAEAMGIAETAAQILYETKPGVPVTLELSSAPCVGHSIGMDKANRAAIKRNTDAIEATFQQPQPKTSKPTQ